MISQKLIENKLNAVDNVAYYVPNFITEEQELYIIEKVNNAPKPKWCQLKNRRLQNWGGIPHSNGLITETIPDWLKRFVDKVKNIEVFPDTNKPNHILVNEYLPGQGIMPHLDGSLFFPTISTISCGSHTILHFYKSPKIHDKVYSLFLERRSLLILQENMYNDYMHGIDEVKDDIIDDSISNLNLCESQIKIGTSLLRNKRISLTIRNVPKISKFNLNSLKG